MISFYRKNLLKKKKIKITKKFSEAIVNLYFKQNNTIVTLTDLKGNTFGWISAGICKFKGAEKKTIFAIQSIAENTLVLLKKYQVKNIILNFKGNLVGREIFIYTLKNKINIKLIEENTSISFNGCRFPKKRRI